jgi:Photosynthetic reaction centre cytochrome C subunit
VKPSSLLHSILAAALLAAAAIATAQTPDSQPPQSVPPGGRRPMRNFPPPTNLQVLPKDTTGKQVRDIMETWAGSLGVHCEFCHAIDPKNIGPNGRPRLNFAEDSKDDKKIARIMYAMTEQINKDYISKTKQIDTDAMGMTVTCGTCHRGHEMPENFVVPHEEHRGGPGGVPPPNGPGAAGAAAPPPADSAPKE